ncbi:MAG: class I SAM-dependent methyltransferase [Deltaproteobacteria bacterium]|nr:class I SAM-dependent methyltransferase [Deltaproteobacteria bacterium]
MITVDFKMLDMKPGLRVLDVGCGTGRHMGAVHRFKDVEVIGADINFDDLLETRKRLIYQESLGEGRGLYEILAADITAIPFEDNFFDLVICSEVLEHIRDQKTAIHEIVRVLKPGKNLVVSVPRFFPERICWTLSADYRNTARGHLRIYKKMELITLLKNAGANKKAVRFVHSLHTPYWWLKCIVGPSRNDSAPVNLYHRFLTWDMMKRPWITRLLDVILNPVLGKSIVLYCYKIE